VNSRLFNQLPGNDLFGAAAGDNQHVPASLRGTGANRITDETAGVAAPAHKYFISGASGGPMAD